MPCSDWGLEWELLHLSLHSCELAHPLVMGDLGPHSNLIPEDGEEA